MKEDDAKAVLQLHSYFQLYLAHFINFPSLFFCHRTLHGVDTNGLVQKALNASNVHENIINYIQEADKISVVTLNTTERVHDVSTIAILPNASYSFFL